MYVHECSGTGSSAPEHMRVRQQVADETVQFGRTHLSHKNHIPFYPLAGDRWMMKRWTIRRDLTADSITSGPSEIPRLDAYLVSESTESSSRHCRQRATQSRRRASRTRYTRYPPPYDPPRGATCYMYEVPVISNSLAPIRCSDVAGGAAKLQDASGMML